MRKLLLASVALLPITAHDQHVGPPAIGTLPGQMPAIDADYGLFAQSRTATNGNTPRSFRDAASDVFNVKEFHAAGDATMDTPSAIAASTDDAGSINNAISAWKAAVSAGRAAALKFPNGRYLVKSDLNFTGIAYADGSRQKIATVDMTGASILCANTGGSCIDATGSNAITWINPGAYGSQYYTPRNIFQGARVAGPSTACGNNTFVGGSFRGWATQTTLLNGACETNQYIGTIIDNDALLTGCHAFINDGQNHFNWQSNFITITTSVDVRLSLEDTTIVGATLASQCYPSSGHDLGIFWSAATGHTNIFGTYLIAFGYRVGGVQSGPTAAFELYDDGHGGNALFKANAHIEGPTTLKYDFLQTGSNTTPVLNTSWKTDAQQATTAIYHLASGITSATLRGNVTLDDVGGVVAPMFDQPSRWTVTGDFRFPSSSFWPSQPAAFQGTLFLGDNFDTALTGAGLASTASVTSALTISPSSGGTLTGTAALHTKKLQQHMVSYELDITVTAASNPAGSFSVGPFPFNPAHPCTLIGRDSGSSGLPATLTEAAGNITGLIYLSNNSAPFAVGTAISFSGVCETTN